MTFLFVSHLGIAQEEVEVQQLQVESKTWLSLIF